METPTRPSQAWHLFCPSEDYISIKILSKLWSAELMRPVLGHLTCSQEDPHHGPWFLPALPLPQLCSHPSQLIALTCGHCYPSPIQTTSCLWPSPSRDSPLDWFSVNSNLDLRRALHTVMLPASLGSDPVFLINTQPYPTTCNLCKVSEFFNISLHFEAGNLFLLLKKKMQASFTLKLS